MNKRNLKFALLLEDGKPVRSIDELRMYYDIDKILAYFHNGQLERWLEQNEYKEQFQMIQTLKETMKNQLISGVNSILIEGKNPTECYEVLSKIETEDIVLGESTNLKHSFTSPLEVEEGIEMIQYIKHIDEIEEAVEIEEIDDIEKIEEIEEIDEIEETAEIYEELKTKEYQFQEKTNENISNNFEEIYASKDIQSEITSEEIQSLFEQSTKDIFKEIHNIEKFELPPISNDVKPSIFKKPLFTDKDEEIYGLNKRNSDEGFKLKIRSKNMESQINRNESFTIKGEEDISLEPKIAIIPEFDFFDDDFFLKGDDNSSEKTINSDKLPSEDDEELELTNDSVEVVEKKNILKENKESNRLFENHAKAPIKKFKFGLEKLNIEFNPLPMDTDIDTGMISNSNKKYSESEIEDNRKQLLQLKKNSVFSKLKADTTLPDSDLVNKIGIEPKASTFEKDKPERKLSNALSFDKTDDMSNFVKNPDSVEMLKEFYVNNKQDDIEPIDNLNSNIDIDNIIRKINTNVENNAKLYNDYEIKKEEHDIFKDTSILKDNLLQPSANITEKEPIVTYIDSTVKNYKATIYNQKDYEDLLVRRTSSDTRLKVIVSCSNIEIKSTDVNIDYIGVNKPTILLIAKTEFDAIEANVSFANLKISSKREIMFNYDKLDNVIIDKSKIKKGIRELIDKYPQMEFNYNEYEHLMEHDNLDKDGRSVEGYVDKVFNKGIENGKIMATVNFDGLHIYTNITMGIINMAFCRTTTGEVHDISEFFVGSEAIDILSKDPAVGIEYVAMLTDDVAEDIKKDSTKEYSSITEIVEDIFLDKNMNDYLEHVILSPIKILKENQNISRIDQNKMIDIMNLDTNIPYVCKVYEGDLEAVKNSLTDFIRITSKNRIQNGIKFKGINIEFLYDESDEFEEDNKDNIIYNFK